MVYFNCSPENMLVMPNHPEVKLVFHYSHIVCTVVNDYESGA